MFAAFRIRNVYVQIVKAQLHSHSRNVRDISENFKLLDKLDKKIVYNSFYKNTRRQKKLKEETTETHTHLRPLSLQYVEEDSVIIENIVNDSDEKSSTHYPFKSGIESITSENDSVPPDATTEEKNLFEGRNLATHSYNWVKTRLSIPIEPLPLPPSSNIANWMCDYENYNDEKNDNWEEWKINYGTPDPRSKISNIPCGGCGALLHCKDVAIPGYLPSEIFKNYFGKGHVVLKKADCQRCHFLKYYNMALKVNVSAEDYLKVLQEVAKQRAVVILMVDLLDFPCSLWPGLADLLGRKPIVVAANKVDLLQQDGPHFMKQVKDVLSESLCLSGFAMSDVKHIELISAKTGFGIENLISKLHSLWKLKGDFYIMGSTNVGKSSLFNALLQSDFCKEQDTDLLQRATTSPWPGTTLNLLKFPVLRPSGWKLYMRMKRLQNANKLMQEQTKLRKEQLSNTRQSKYATIIGHIGRTFFNTQDIQALPTDQDVCGAQAEAIGSDDFKKEEKNEGDLNRWCYDTPGVVHSDQIIHLLTTEELIKTLPKELVRPRTFCLKPNTTIFIAGLARLDYLQGKFPTRFTVFCSDALPITICNADDAQEVYDQCLGTEVFQVPMEGNSTDRLKEWPGLERGNGQKDITVIGIYDNYACADIVLSNAGWIAVNGKQNEQIILRAWTPEGRGVYVRSALLPMAVTLRGKRRLRTPAYENNKFYLGK